MPNPRFKELKNTLKTHIGISYSNTEKQRENLEQERAGQEGEKPKAKSFPTEDQEYESQ